MTSYKYEIISVNTENKIMTVKYTMGSLEQEIGIRLPSQDETLDELLQSCSPFGQEMLQTNYQNISVGKSGTLDILQTSKPLHEQIHEHLPDYPETSQWSVEQLENKSFVNLRTERYYNKKAQLVAVKLHGPTVIDTKTASTTMLSARTFIDSANELGVPVIMVNDVKSYADFAKSKLQGMKVISLGRMNLIYRVWDSQLETAKQNSLSDEMRAKRNELLVETDWIHLPDTAKPANIDSWVSYRQKLRDVTSQAEFPQNIKWPVKPA